MPLILIEVRKKYTQEQEIALMKAVYDALKSAFKITIDDAINVRLIAHEPHRFSVAASKTQAELYTQITVDCYPGRSPEIKKEFYRLVIEKLATFGIPQDHIKILIRESNKENWGILGGQAGTDVDVGYKVEI